jgi:hypothetical protein
VPESLQISKEQGGSWAAFEWLVMRDASLVVVTCIKHNLQEHGCHQFLKFLGWQSGSRGRVPCTSPEFNPWFYQKKEKKFSLMVNLERMLLQGSTGQWKVLDR